MDYDEANKILGEMSEFERGWYHACISNIFWNVGNDYETDPQVLEWRMPVDLDQDGRWVITVYSPTGQNDPPKSFYDDGKRGEDAIDVIFDISKFRAVWMELDPHGLNYCKLIDRVYVSGPVGLRTEDYYSHELIVLVASTESNLGMPDDWETPPHGDGTIETIRITRD